MPLPSIGLKRFFKKRRERGIERRIRKRGRRRKKKRRVEEKDRGRERNSIKKAA